MVYADRIEKVTQVRFGGLRHHENCADGELYDMENMSCEKYPILTVRGRRGRIVPVTPDVRQIYADNGMMLEVDAAGLWYNGFVLATNLKDYENTYFVRFGDRVLMMPDKRLLNLNYKVRDIAADAESLPQATELYEAYAVQDEGGHFSIYVWDGETWVDNGWFDEPVETGRDFFNVTIRDGKLYEEKAAANTLCVKCTYEIVTSYLRLKAGDAVTISGLSQMPENNKTAIIREIAESNMEGWCDIRFSDNCFKMPLGEDGEPLTSYQENGPITIARTMPDMDFMFEHENRLWGAKGKEIFASKLGDPRNWNCFEGLSTDSWYMKTQGKGEFTGGISYHYPRFFKEDGMTTVYGTIPSAFQTTQVQLTGVKKGEHKSIAKTNGLLFWLSQDAPVIYNGSSAQIQDQVFGGWKLSAMIAAVDMSRYYCYAEIAGGGGALFRYDTQRGLWTKESSHKICCMTAMDGVVYALDDGGQIETLNATIGPEDPEEAFDSFAEFGDFTDGHMNRKGVSRLQLRLEVSEGASVAIYIQYDSSGQWRKIKSVSAGKKRSVYLPIIPRRCDHYRIKLMGYGEWKLHSMVRERYHGGETL